MLEGGISGLIDEPGLLLLDGSEQPTKNNKLTATNCDALINIISLVYLQNSSLMLPLSGRQGAAGGEAEG